MGWLSIQQLFVKVADVFIPSVIKVVLLIPQLLVKVAVGLVVS